MMNATTRILGAGIITCLVIAGCDAAGDGPEEASGGDQTLVSRTIVLVSPDGTNTIVEETVTVAQQRAEIAARKRAVKDGTWRARPGTATNATLLPDGVEAIGSALARASCDDPAVSWLFSGPALTGSQLCLMGAGTAQLDSYLLSCGPISKTPPFAQCTGWKGHVGSYWVGASGAFRKDTRFVSLPDDINWVSFAYWDEVDSVPAPSFSVIRLDF